MYYQESDTLLGSGDFQREDVEQFDALLFKSQNRAIRIGRAADLLSFDVDLTNDILEAYANS